VYRDFRTCLPAREGSSVARVLQLQVLPPCKVELRCAMCPAAPDPAFLQGRAPVRYVSCSSRSCLPTGEGSGAPRVLRLWILPPCRGGIRSTTCPTAPDPASLPGGLRCRHHMPCGFMWDADFKHKEKPSKHVYAARLVCSQHTRVCFKGV
jgi:hypothetical protein